MMHGILNLIDIVVLDYIFLLYLVYIHNGDDLLHMYVDFICDQIDSNILVQHN
jgi:hypothetical protein